VVELVLQLMKIRDTDELANEHRLAETVSAMEIRMLGIQEAVKALASTHIQLGHALEEVAKLSPRGISINADDDKIKQSAKTMDVSSTRTPASISPKINHKWSGVAPFQFKQKRTEPFIYWFFSFSTRCFQLQMSDGL
jgi:hypothetical protein